MKVCLALQNFLFEHRLCWLLSSVLQQDGDIPEIEINVAYVLNSGKPQCEDVLSLFQKVGLKIVHTVYPAMTTIMYRGLTRNEQVRDTAADWILFADADHVYPPNFFSEMKRLLDGEFRNNPHCLHSGRRSTFLEATEALIDSRQYPCIISNAYEKASKLESKKKSMVGAGNMHLCNVRLLRENHEGLYVEPKKNKDKSWVTKCPCARSDMQFRRKLGKKNIGLPRAIHLQHIRGAVEGEGRMLYNQK